MISKIFVSKTYKKNRIDRIGLTYESPVCRPTFEQGATLFGSAAMRPPGIWHEMGKGLAMSVLCQEP